MNISFKMENTAKELFYSLGQRYAGKKEPDLELHLSNRNDNALEVELVNLNYKQKRTKKIKQLGFLIFIFFMQRCLLQKQPFYLYMLFGLWLSYLINSIFNTIKSMKLVLYGGIALQLETNRFGYLRQIYCVSTSSIYDLVINEVIEMLDIHYLLILRTNGSLFKKKPIVPLFNELKPSVECLHVIYKNVKTVLNFNKQII